MKNTTKTPFLLLLLLIAALGVPACGSDESSDSSVAGGGEVGGGEAVCDQATFDGWVKAYGESNNTTATLPADSFECADGWAVLFPTVGDAGSEFPETVVVQAEGGIWALMDREMACGTDEASAEVPASLYQQACQTN
ncbi:MAG: hypothetical protein ACKOSO_02630 [Actinomycetota bacterium]